MPDVLQHPTPAAPPATPPPNRLSIAHLMLWTLGTALVLAVFREFFRPLNIPSDADTTQVAPSIMVFMIACSLPMGAQVASVALWGIRRWRGRGGFPVQPGHWLLLVEGAIATLGWLAPFSARLVFTGTGGALLAVALQVLVVVAGLTGYVLATIAVQEESRSWQNAVRCLLAGQALAVVLLIALIVIVISQTVEEGGVPSAWIPSPISVPCLCTQFFAGVFVFAAAWGEWLQRAPRRDYLHWSGVASLLLLLAARLAMPMGVYF